MAQTLRSRVLRDHGMERAGGRERLAAHGCMSCGKAVSGNKRICLDCAAAQYQAKPAWLETHHKTTLFPRN